MKFIFVFLLLIQFVFVNCRKRDDDEGGNATPSPKPNPSGLTDPQDKNAIDPTNYLPDADTRMIGSWSAKPYSFKTVTLKFEGARLTLGVQCTDSGKLMEAFESTAKFEVSKKLLKVNETLNPIRSNDQFRCESKMSGNFPFRIETDNEFVLIVDPATELRFTRQK